MSQTSTLLPLIAALPFVGALLPGLMIRAGRNMAALSAAFATLLALVMLLIEAPSVMQGNVLRADFEWMPILGLNVSFMLDGLGLLFALMILGVGLLIILYARYYLSRSDPMGQFYTYLLLFQGAMLGIVLSNNVLLLLIFWELTSLSSFLLIGYWKHLPAGRQGARMALAVTGMGGLAMIGGMLILGDIAGSYDLDVILTKGAEIKASPLYLPALLLILLGAFTKSAQFPFHFWLPHAMAAPTPVSAYLHSATMVKAGIFLMARMWPVLAGTDAWFYIVAGTGLVTMVVGASIALFKNDLKALLAYSTVSHLGLITMLLGFGTKIAAVAAVFHIINHVTFKAALFMSAGIVDHSVHTRDIKRLGGLAALMPITAVIATITALSMAGIPFLNGFLSKEMMLEEAAHTVWLDNHWLVPALATFGALLSVAYSLRYIMHVFAGKPRNDYPATPHDPGFGLWAAPAFLAVLVVLIGIFPQFMVDPLVAITAGAVTGGDLPHYELKIWHGLTPAVYLSIIAVGGGALLLTQHCWLARLWDATPRPEAKVIFDALVNGLAKLANWFTGALHNGAISRYLAIFTAASVGLGVIVFSQGTHVAGTRELLPVPPLAAMVWVMLVVAAITVVVYHRARFLSLVLIGIIGITVSLGFVYLSAPDLAMTQISVEIVTIMLLLLALNFLPKRSPIESGAARRIRDGVIALSAGGGIAALAYSFMIRDFTTLSDFYIANSHSGGGGDNVVNVILVDFRGYDTFGEIIVLGIAALTIFSLMEALLVGKASQRLATWVHGQKESKDRHPMMNVVVTRVMMPIAIMVGVFIFLRGHNQPGGGFIAGLVVAIALLMQYMASGFSWAQERQRIEYHTMVGVGVLIAAFTGAGALLVGKPFLTSAFGYLDYPPLEKFEWATAALFDLGVFLTVVGAVMLTLYSFSRISRRAGEVTNVEAMDFDPRPEPEGK
ncbi:MAG: monovalent cation/H+ antiporter subunit A [Rhodobacteraceae bacterium]|nr:monovalent cation/H+ antiporter subunit A [Paracoccaceae bacterium]